MTTQVATSIKCSLPQEALLSALTLVIKAVSKRPTLQVLSCLLIEARGSGVTFSSTNLEQGISHWRDAEVEHEGVCVIDAKILLDCVKTFPKTGIVTIVIVEDRLHVSCGKRIFKLNYWRDATEFPNLSRNLDSIPLVIESNVLRQKIKEVQFASATDDSRPILSTVCMDIQDKGVNFVGASGFRMAISQYVSPEKILAPQVSLLVPVSSMDILMPLLPDKGNVAITWDEKCSQILFQFGRTTFLSRLTEGTYVNYMQAVPQSHTSSFVLGSNELGQTLKALLPFAKDSSDILRISYGDGAVRLSATSEDLGEACDEIATPIEGADDRIALNILFLVEMLKYVPAEGLLFQVSGERYPCVIMPFGRGDYRYVVMPMNLTK